MAESLASTNSTVAKLYAALLDRAPEASGMTFWATAAANGAPWADIVRGMLDAPAARDAYPTGLPAVDFVATLYRMLFDREPDAGGVAFWANALSARGEGSAEARAWLVLQVLDAASQPLAARPDGMSESDYARTVADRAVLANKAEAGVYFATVLGSDDITLARQMMAKVTADPASVQAAIDTATGLPPAPPPVPLPPGEPTITSSALTKDALPILSGAADAGTTVQVTIGGVTYAVATTGGVWHLDLATATPLSGTLALNENGSNAISAIAIGAGGASTSATQTLVIDTTPPQQPVVTSAAATHLSAPVITGTAQAGDTVTVTIAGATYTLATVDGAWQLDLATATPTSGTLALNTHGANAVSVVATDAAGNVSAPGTQVLDIDPNHAPQPAITSADTVAIIRQKFADYPGTIAKVAAAGLSAEQWTEVATHLDKVGAGNITGAMVLTAEVATGDALALLTKYSGTTARLDASVHNLTTLQTLANDARVGVLTGLSLSLADTAMTDALTAVLLGKAGGARVDATGATLQELRALGNAGYMSDKLADGGITGTVTIDKELNLAQQLGLLGSKMSASAVIAANATNLDASALKALAVRAGQLTNGGIQGAMHLNSQLNATEIGVLIDHFGGTFISAHVSSGMNATVIAKMAANYGKFFNITGDLAMSGSLPIDQVIGLLSKYSGTTATITSPTYAVTDLDQLASDAKVASLASPKLIIVSADGNTSAQLGRILAKSQNATVDNAAGEDALLPTLLANLGKIVAGGITNWGASDRIALDHDTLLPVSFGTFVAKLASDIKFAVDAAQMNADQVVALFAQSGKVAALSNLSIPEGAFSRLPDDVEPLFKLQTGIHADLTGARNAQLDKVSQFVFHLADNGLTGTFTLTESLDATALDRLLTKSAVAANVTVDVTRMDTEQVNAVLAHLDKADTIIGLSVAADSPFLADPAALASLLAAGSNTAIDLHGASQAVVDVVLDNLQGVANSGLHRADLTLSAAQWQGLDAGQLSAKLAIDALVKVQGSAANETLDFTQMARPYTVDAGAGADTIRLSSGASTVLLGGRADTKAVDFSSNTAPPTGIDSLLGVHNGVTLKLSRDVGAYIDGVALQAGATMSPAWASMTYNSGMTFEDIYRVANNMNGGVIGSTGSLVQVRGVQFTNGGESHYYLFVNDGVGGIDENDFVVHLVGGGMMQLTV